MNPSPYGLCEREIVGRPALRPPRACMGVGMFSGHLCRGRRPRRPAEGSRPLPTMQTSNRRRRRVAGRACPAPTGWWMVGGCWPGGAGGIYATPYGQAYCNIRIPDKHHYISKEVLLAPLSFFVVSCYNILCIVGKNSKVFSIFDKYGTKTVKTIEDVVGLIGG